MVANYAHFQCRLKYDLRHEAITGGRVGRVNIWKVLRRVDDNRGLETLKAGTEDQPEVRRKMAISQIKYG